MARKATTQAETNAEDSYHHGDLRRALIRAGVELVDEGGDEALSLREVARRAGVSHAAPYRHFADKHALLAAIAADGFERLHQRLAAASDQRIGRQRLLAVLAAYVRFGVEHRQDVRVMFGPVVHQRSQALEAVAKDSFGQLVAAVADAQAERGTAVAPPTQVALALWAQAHGLVLLAEHVDFRELSPADSNVEAIDACLVSSADALLAQEPAPTASAVGRKASARATRGPRRGGR